ncbi:hypothetical protein P872_10305 [Rhodonellum psychrophilum GCM71 = DSM 17998]|uniref:Uncharacterized protein n=1 Tax=Rhodonellum psychrophilum GCM71 = DSM 17998 TaxID=1123057 RepID=U5BXZ5_9BACT|nr:hypothetical protein P872_10305 [Rhodonellum psychrophilum GCM71 = DSM 17998]
MCLIDFDCILLGKSRYLFYSIFAFPSLLGKSVVFKSI